MRPEALVLYLARAAIEGGVLMGLAWVVGRAWPGLPAAARALVWWWVCARLLVSLLPLAPLHVAMLPVPVLGGSDGPILSALSSSVTVPEPGSARTALEETPAGDADVETSLPVTEVESAAPVLRVLPGAVGMQVFDELPRARAQVAARALDPVAWMSLAAWALLVVWGAGVGFRLMALLFQSLHVRHLARDARPVGWSRMEGERGHFRVAVSDRIRVPLALGLLRPRILIPSRMLERTADDLALALALAHEGAHLRRGHLWMAWIPAVAEALFWFHPLARVAAREYLQACEEACDEDALRATGISPYRYGRLLLAFGVERPLGAAAIPLGSPHADQLHRRLTMLQRVVSVSRRARVAAAAVVGLLAALALTPVHVVPTAATPRTPAPTAPVTPAPDPSSAELQGLAEAPEAPETPEAPQAAQAPEAPEKAVTPRPGRAPRARVVAESGCVSECAGEAITAIEAVTGCAQKARKAAAAARALAVTSPAVVAPLAMVVPPIPVTPPIPPTPPTPSAGRKASAFAYVLVNGDGEQSGSGESEDWGEVKRLRGSVKGDFFWVRIDGRRYLIEDPAVLERIREIFEPQRELGDQQSMLGDRQSSLGDRQSELGDRQAELGDRQSELADRQMELAEQEAHATSMERKRELERIHRELMEAQEELGQRQEELGQRQQLLGRGQEELGRHQEALARQMARHSAQIRSELRALVEEAARQGQARRLP